MCKSLLLVLGAHRHHEWTENRFESKQTHTQHKGGMGEIRLQNQIFISYHCRVLFGSFSFHNTNNSQEWELINLLLDTFLTRLRRRHVIENEICEFLHFFIKKISLRHGKWPEIFFKCLIFFVTGDQVSCFGWSFCCLVSVESSRWNTERIFAIKNQLDDCDCRLYAIWYNRRLKSG